MKEFLDDLGGLGDWAGLLFDPGDGAGVQIGFGVVVVAEFGPGDGAIDGDEVLFADGSAFVFGDGEDAFSAVVRMPGEGECEGGSA